MTIGVKLPEALIELVAENEAAAALVNIKYETFARSVRRALMSRTEDEVYEEVRDGLKALGVEACSGYDPSANLLDLDAGAHIDDRLMDLLDMEAGSARDQIVKEFAVELCRLAGIRIGRLAMDTMLLRPA